MPVMTGKELAERLMQLPDLPVGNQDAEMVISVTESVYDTADLRDVPYIALDIEEGPDL